MRRLLLTAVVLAACDSPVAPPVDAGPPDGGPPPCLRWDPEMESFNWAECGICIRPHERLIERSPAEATGVAVADGLLVLTGVSLVRLHLVRRDGVVVSIPDYVYVDGVDPYPTFPARIVPVAGQRAVWVVKVRRPAFGETTSRGTELVLYEYDTDGFWKVAQGVVPEWLGFTPIAFRHRDLLVHASDGIGLNPQFGLVRPTPSGGLEFVPSPDFPIGGEPAALVRAWHAGDEIALIVRPDTDYLDYWLRVREGMEVTAGPVRLVPHDDRFRDQPDVRGSLPRADGSASVLLAGALIGDAANGAHLLLQRVGADGMPVWDPPGVLINPEQYARATGSSLSEPGTWPDAVWEIGGEVGIAWHEYPRGQWVQTVRRDGSLGLPEPWERGGYEIPAVPRVWAGPTATDGTGAVYAWYADLVDPNPGPPADAFFDQIAVDRLRVDGTYAWPRGTVVQQCTFEDGRIDGQQWLPIVGDLEAGVWVLWSDDLLDRDGRPHSLLKVTLVRPDGSFAW